MARNVGSYGTARIEFEQGFLKACEEDSFNAGRETVKLLQAAVDRKNIPEFVALLSVANRYLTERGDTAGQGDLTLVVDRRRESIEHNPAN